MSWIIDEFKVKPSGFLAAWRYKRVLIDDNGLLTTSGVPDKEDMNKACIADYNKVSRRYKSSGSTSQDRDPSTGADLITSFCNRDTFTKYRVYAQDCDPFAYVQQDLNSTDCGYLTPTPTPATPPNPFGTAVYGLYKFFTFCDDDAIEVVVNIYRKDFSGSVEQIKSGGGSPVIISYQSEDYKFTPIRSCEAQLNFIADENFSLQEFYTADEREFKVIITKGTTVKFEGFIIPDSCQEPFISPPYPVSIRATDGLGALKKVSYPMPVGSSINIRQSFLDILAYALAMTNLALDIYTTCNLYERKMDTGLNDDPLDQATVNPMRMANGSNVFTVYEVLETLCKQFGAFIAQIDGAWHFVRMEELTTEVIRRRVYNSTALFIRGENASLLKKAGVNKEVLLIDNRGEIRIGNAYKRASVQLEYGKVPSLVFNGDFENWDGQNFRYWTRYGGINVSRLQKSLPGAGGAPVLIEDYAALFNEVANAGKWLETGPISVLKGEKVKLSFGVGNTDDNYFIKIRVKIGKYYLYNTVTEARTERIFPLSAEPTRYIPGSLGPYEWVESLATSTTLIIKSSERSAFFEEIAINMPEAPVSGSMIIQFLGFVNEQTAKAAIYTNPIAIDDVSVSKSSEDEGKGVLYLSQQLGFYTETPEITTILFGEYNKEALTGGTRTERFEATELNNLYAIYTKDNSYATGWYSYGQSSAPLPIGLALAKTIIKAYQKPFRFFTGNFKGRDLNYLMMLNIIVPSSEEFSARTFAIQTAEFDLKYNTMSAQLVEMFSKNIVTSDVSIPHAPGDSEPPFIQNPNNPQPTPGSGIFTSEFTNEFI